MTYKIYDLIDFYFKYMTAYLSFLVCSFIFIIIYNFINSFTLASGISLIIFIALISLIQEIRESNEHLCLGKLYKRQLAKDKNAMFYVNEPPIECNEEENKIIINLEELLSLTNQSKRKIKNYFKKNKKKFDLEKSKTKDDLEKSKIKDNLEYEQLKSHVTSRLIYMGIFIFCIFTLYFIDESRYFTAPIFGLIGAKFAEYLRPIYKIRLISFIIITIGYVFIWIMYFQVPPSPSYKETFYVLSIITWFGAGIIFQLTIFGIDKAIVFLIEKYNHRFKIFRRVVFTLSFGKLGLS